MNAHLDSSSKEFPLVVRIDWPDISAPQILRGLGCQQGAVLWEGFPANDQSSLFPTHLPGRYSYIGLPSRTEFTVANDKVVYRTTGQTERVVSLKQYQEDPFGPIAEQLQRFAAKATRDEIAAQNGASLPPFVGGLIGFISYDAARYLENVKGSSGHSVEPDVYFKVIDTLIVIDHQTHELLLISWPVSDEGGKQTQNSLANLKANSNRLIALLEDIRSQPLNNQRRSARTDSALPLFDLKFESDDFVKIVSRAKEYIKAGDIFQVVLGNTLSIDLQPDPLELYELLCLLNPSPYHFLVNFGDHTLVGASPEVMLRSHRIPETSEQLLSMRLVAGTYPRESFETEAECIDALLADEKERAEHIMLVDHCRNDIGRSAKIGSVKPSDLCSVERYLDVYHLVSQVSGILPSEQSSLSALRSCFPIATLTGTPKIRAMEIIAELEGSSRGSFGGAVAMLGYDGFIDSGVIIRTALVGPQSTVIRAGAGIVDDSSPEREHEECLWKARALLKAVALACEEKE